MKLLPACHRPTAISAGGTGPQRRRSPLSPHDPLDKKHGSSNRSDCYRLEQQLPGRIRTC